MAEIPNSPGSASHDAREENWEHMKQGDEGRPIPALDYNRLAVQLSGDLAGAHVSLVGRLTPAGQFWTLPDQEGYSMQIRMGAITIAPFIAGEIKPKIVGGNEATDVTVTVLLKR
jgi:hypothetical protein